MLTLGTFVPVSQSLLYIKEISLLTNVRVRYGDGGGGSGSAVQEEIAYNSITANFLNLKGREKDGGSISHRNTCNATPYYNPEHRTLVTSVFKEPAVATPSAWTPAAMTDADKIPNKAK
jgi:hypothetical protein